MTDYNKAEINVLDRLVDMLGETSVSHLTQSDDAFASFVEQLYATIDTKMSDLQLVGR